MMNNNNLLYTTIFKLHNVVLASSKKINLAKDVWIEAAPKYKGQPVNFSTSVLMFDRDPLGLGLSRFYKSLIDSDVVIGTQHFQDEIDNNPFDLHDCSYIAIALSILSDYFLVAGIETFSNNRNTNSPSLGPWTTLFMGKKTNQIIITSTDESQLLQMYNFVFQSLKASSHDSAKAKLIFLYLKCIIRQSNQQFTALKMGVNPLLNERSAIIVNTALFFEHIFTQESENPLDGVDLWNKNFDAIYAVKQDDVNLIMKYRHVLVHDNATRAKKYINDWKEKKGFSDKDAFDNIEETSILAVKTCMRAIVTNYGSYLSYRATLPK
ncbi:MAG: hypothetical protein UZ14_CFX002002476 [Chloroflexi bacterium OLB14]|nr:MAG: hypothetical protein UZ14_CFX002002476 [Chloroflexi bacterium OLB14]